MALWRTCELAVEMVCIGCGETPPGCGKAAQRGGRMGGRLWKACGMPVENTPDSADDLWTVTGNAL